MTSNVRRRQQRSSVEQDIVAGDFYAGDVVGADEIPDAYLQSL